jgi:hypothetical protein
MLAIIGLVFPFLKSFLGEGVIQSYLKAQNEKLASANELERVKITADVNMAAFELKRREAQRDLQLAELPYAEMRRPKALLMWAVALYWFGRFIIEALGLGDFHIVIHPLSPDMDLVSKMILGYMFLDGAIKRVVAK